MKKSMSVILGSALLLTSSYSVAAKLGETATKFVPDSKVVHEEKNEVKLQSSSGSVIEVEFKRGGDFKEASGSNADKDQFLPPENLMPLQNVVESLKKAGKSPVGKWSLEKGMLTGWVYEFKTFENGKEMEHIVDAKTAEIKKSKEDK